MSAKKPENVEIYALIDPRDGVVRYIGKAICAERRLKQHLRETRRDYPVYRWIRHLLGLGLVPQLRIECVCAESEWQAAERSAIAKARETNARLLNVADGGDEPFCPTDVRAKNCRDNAKKRVSDPVKAKLWKLKQMIGVSLKQGYVSEKTKAKLRALAIKCPSMCGEWASL